MNQFLASRYRIASELGRGGMGVVYKALDTEKNTYVAIKTIPPELAHHPEFLKRFQQEARALMRLHHPHVVGLIDLLHDQGNHYMVLEYVDGPSLSRLLAKGPLPPQRAREIALQVAGALSYSHAHNIVHRDIKPSNILLTKEGQVKVTDFGIARILDATLGTLTGKVFGTARYASPEQVKGLKVDHRSDLYSLGVVLYEMLTGRPPFLGTDDEVMQQHIRAEPVPPSQLNEEVPALLETITLRCLEKDRDSRYQGAEELAANLRRAKVDKEPLVGEKPKGGRDKRQPIVAFAAITAILVVALVALAVVIWPRLESSRNGTMAADVSDYTPEHQPSPTGADTEAPASPAETQPPAATPSEVTIVPTPVSTPLSTETGQPTPTPVAVSAPGVGSTGFGYGAELAQVSSTTLGHLNTLSFQWAKLQIRWESQEPSPGAVDWWTLDGVVSLANGAGNKLLFSVVTTPSWARARTESEGPPDDPATLANFVGAMAERYCGKVQAIEIWNGQNLITEWNTGRGINAKEYMDLLKICYRRIKSVCPQMIVVSGAPTPTGLSDGYTAVDDVEYLRLMYANGLKDYCDAVGVHPSGFDNPPDADWRTWTDYSGFNDHRSFFFSNTIKSYHDVMVQNGDGNKRLWATEFGWATIENMSATPNLGYEYAATNTEATQAEYLVKAMQIAEESGYMGVMFVWNLDFSVEKGAGWEGSKFSLLRADGTPRPAYHALAGMSK
jgi:serine/threonine protein kinase